MEHTNVIQLSQFKTEVALAGCPSHRLTEIASEIGKRPTHGHCLIDLRGEFCNEPLVGFYTRSWRYNSEMGARLEGCSLHLYLSPTFPVYLFNFASCLEHEVPWTTPWAQDMLKAAGLAVYLEYVTSGAQT